MIELLSGDMGTMQMVLGWLLVCYPVLTLPILIRYLSYTEEVGEDSSRRRRSRRARVEYDDEEDRGFRRPRAEDLWRAEQAERDELPVAAPSNALTLNQLLDVLEEASRLERTPAPPVRSRGIDPIELQQLLEADVEPAVPDTVSQRRLRREEAPPRRPESLAERREARAREAARRVAGNPKMQRWVRSAARELLARTGTEG